MNILKEINNSLNKTDRAVNYTALILISTLTFFGYIKQTDMSETIVAAIISVAGALIAAGLASFGTVYLTNRKELKEKKNKLDFVKVSIIKIFENQFIPSTEEVLKSCENTQKALNGFISETINSINLSLGEEQKDVKIDVPDLVSFASLHYMHLEILDFLNKEDLITLFIQENIGSDVLYDLLNTQSYLKSNNPELIYDSFILEYESIISKLNSLEKTMSESNSKKLKEYKDEVIILKQKYNSTLKGNLTFIQDTLKLFNSIINKLK